jgi:hypothetical protein
LITKEWIVGQLQILDKDEAQFLERLNVCRGAKHSLTCTLEKMDEPEIKPISVSEIGSLDK